jgi:hypothetical protein
VTVLFADLKGSMELLADRDPARCVRSGARAPHRRGHALREMGMTYWLDKAAAEMRPLA